MHPRPPASEWKALPARGASRPLIDGARPPSWQHARAQMSPSRPTPRRRARRLFGTCGSAASDLVSFPNPWDGRDRSSGSCLAVLCSDSYKLKARMTGPCSQSVCFTWRQRGSGRWHESARAARARARGAHALRGGRAGGRVGPPQRQRGTAAAEDSVCVLMYGRLTPSAGIAKERCRCLASACALTLTGRQPSQVLPSLQTPARLPRRVLYTDFQPGSPQP